MPKRKDIKKILIIGSGPIVIGQACEFDYSGVQACKALRDEGYETVLVNSNPATIMTDPEMANRTYIEPLSKEYLEAIIIKEQPDALLPTVGGQTALNLAVELAESGILEKHKVEMIGASLRAIKVAEDRLWFKDACRKIGLDVPASALVNNVQDALKLADQLGYLVRLDGIHAGRGLVEQEQLRPCRRCAGDLEPSAVGVTRRVSRSWPFARTRNENGARPNPLLTAVTWRSTDA